MRLCSNKVCVRALLPNELKIISSFRSKKGPGAFLLPPSLQTFICNTSFRSERIVPSFLLFLYITSPLLSLQLPYEVRKDATNTKVD